MAKDFVDKSNKVISELRQAIAALERAQKNDYPPHVSACLEASRGHFNRARVMASRL